MDLAPETIDGLIFETRLIALERRHPEMRQRREAFWAGVKADKEALRPLSSERLIVVLKHMNPAYIVELLQQKTHEALVDRVAMSMRGKDRPKWREALGLPPEDQACGTVPNSEGPVISMNSMSGDQSKSS